MALINRPRGTNDLFGKQLDQHRHVLDKCANLARLAGYREVIIPTFERVELFHRQNESSDVVQKELYEFADRGGRMLALRPEGTASVVRCLAENNLLRPEDLPVRTFTFGSMFRYERPQSGRAREFIQFDVESIGGDSLFETVATIAYGARVLRALKIGNVHLELNFIGSYQSRANWIAALKQYFAPYRHELSVLSQHRLETNPLRILDDKVDGQLQCVKQAPQITTYLSSAEKQRFATIQQLLKMCQIDFCINPLLVRGLDYYVDVVFEFVASATDTKQTIAAGGQYDGLVKELAGTDLQAVGMAFGIERCAALMGDQPEPEWNERLDLFALADVDQNVVAALREQWLNANVPITFNAQINDIKKALRTCVRTKTRYLALLGTREMQTKTVTIKDLFTQQQQTMPQAALITWWTKKTEQ